MYRYLLWCMPFAIHRSQGKEWWKRIRPPHIWYYFLCLSSKAFILNRISTFSLLSFIVLCEHEHQMSTKARDSITKRCECVKEIKDLHDLTGKWKLNKKTTTLLNFSKTHSSCDMNKTIHCYLPLCRILFFPPFFDAYNKNGWNSLCLSSVKVCFVLSCFHLIQCSNICICYTAKFTCTPRYR